VANRTAHGLVQPVSARPPGSRGRKSDGRNPVYPQDGPNQREFPSGRPRTWQPCSVLHRHIVLPLHPL